MTDPTDFRSRGQRSATFRFELLDRYNSYIGDLPVDMDSPPSIDMNINRAVKRSMSGLRLPPSVTADINTLHDRIKPWMVFPEGDEHPLGVFLFADASRRQSLYGSVGYANVGVGEITEGSCLDQGCTLNQGSRTVNFYGPPHRIYDALVQQLELGGVFDYYIDPTDDSFAQWVVWKPNANRLTVINDICRLGGYYSLYFDNDGVAQLRQVPSLEAVEPTINYDLDTSVIADSVVESDDLLNAPNTYVVINSAFTEAPVWGEWRVPASAPHSYENRGFWVVKEIDMQGIETNAAATRAAKAQGQADYATYRWVNFETAINPRHDSFDIVGWRGEKYREQSWTIRCIETATQPHELRRVWSDEVAELLEEAA